MEPEKGYKVVRKRENNLPCTCGKEGEFFSLISVKGAVRKYKVNEWTSRKRNCGPLALMPTYELALELAKACHDANFDVYAIFEAEYIPSKVKDKLWYLKTTKAPLSWDSDEEITFGVVWEAQISSLSKYVSVISQTVLADKIKITKQLM